MSEKNVEELQKVIIKEELMALVKTYYGNKQGIHMRAAYLNNLIFWQSIRMKSAKTELNKIDRAIKNKIKATRIEKMKKDFRGNWFYKTSDEQMEELMGFCSPSSITRMNKEFEKQGWLEYGNNPDPKKKWDKATWYKLDLVKINADLNKLGYHLEGFKFDDTEQTLENSIFHGEKSTVEPFVEVESKTKEDGQSPVSPIFHGESSIFHGESSIFHDGRTIPEGITEGLTKDIKKEEEEDQLKILFSTFINSIGNINKTVRNEITEMSKLLPIEVIKNEIEFCSKKGAKSWSYVEEALKEDLRLNVNSVYDLENKRNEHKSKKNNVVEFKKARQGKAIRKEESPEEIFSRQEKNNPSLSVNEQEEKKQEIDEMLKKLRS